MAKKTSNKRSGGGKVSKRPAPVVTKSGLRKGRYGCGGKLSK